MTQQWKPSTAHKSRGIQWCDETWNPVGGCMHGCRWEMPDGNVAICYAEDVANSPRLKERAYQHGFEHHYFREHMLGKNSGSKTSKFIFCDSMSDLMGHWVPEADRQAVFDAIRNSPQHTYQMLTKAAPQLLKLEEMPPNMWVGVSSPPDFMFGKRLSRRAQMQMLRNTLETLETVRQKHGNIVWMSLEPVSWDMADIMRETGVRLDWAVIGAATDGRKKFQPEEEHVQKLLDLFDEQGTPVFFKGNLDWSPFREDFPVPPKPYDGAVRERQKNAKKYGWPTNVYLEAHDKAHEMVQGALI